ncbi:MAG: MFS transporter [Anaerolineales bacterium]|nr:MAG: MFS transporter [Anaerolineales bacterium]
MLKPAPLPAPEAKTGYARLSLSYFFIFAAWACITPFFVLYLQSLGFSGAQIGILTGIGPLIGLAAKPFWAGYADATNRHRLVLYLSVGAAVVLNAIFPFLRSFTLILGVQILMAMLSSHTLPLLDSATIHMMGSNRDRYGSVRLWGTVAWGIVSALAGFALDRLGLASMFWIFCGLMSVNLFLLRSLEFEENPERGTYFAQVGRLLREPQWLLFLGTVLVAGIGSTAHDYLPLLIQALPGVSNWLPFAVSGVALVGIAITISTISETPIMAASHWFLRSLGSRGALYLSMLAMAVRCFIYSNTATPDQALLIQLMHGLTYPLMWVAGIKFVAEMAPRGLSSTAQGLFSAMFMGIGTALGYYLCGWLIDEVGVFAMFSTIGWVVSVCLLLSVLLSLLLSRSKRQPAKAGAA